MTDSIACSRQHSCLWQDLVGCMNPGDSCWHGRFGVVSLPGYCPVMFFCIANTPADKQLALHKHRDAMLHGWHAVNTWQCKIAMTTHRQLLASCIPFTIPPQMTRQPTKSPHLSHPLQSHMFMHPCNRPSS